MRRISQVFAIALTFSCLFFGTSTAANSNPDEWDFLHWCVDRDRLTTEAKHTVEMLLEVAETTDCDRAHAVLQQSDRLDLSEKSIADLRPLATLTHITHLILYGNRIRDISPLETLIHLQQLQIWDNCIEDLTPIFNLPHLISFNIGNRANCKQRDRPLLGMNL
ncbi:MAG: hypothetical protein J7647_08870 [Cyanobacteria bacterium SBLK]|nr:hypothetical protein [Cyanobacteria bacterium SBLK]